MTQPHMASVMNKSSSHERFHLETTFELQVPQNYLHGIRLRTFRREEESSEHFYKIESELTDNNFEWPSVVLYPGQRFTVSIFGVRGVVTLDESLEFLRNRNSALVGAQGATLVWQVGYPVLPLAKRILSLDERRKLPRFGRGFGIPYVTKYSTGGISMHVESSSVLFDQKYCIASFVSNR